MATLIAASCPKCDKQIKAAPELVGKKVRCKECRTVFEVKPAGDKAAAPAAKGGKGGAVKADVPDPRFDRDDKPYDVTQISLLPRCAYCAKELEEEDQVICLHCGYNMRTRERIKPRKVHHNSGGDYFLWLLPGIICAIVTLLLIGVIVLVWILYANNKDATEGAGQYIFGKGMSMWETIISIFIGFWTTRFAIKRLIFNPHPPEKEKHK